MTPLSEDPRRASPSGRCAECGMRHAPGENTLCSDGPTAGSTLTGAAYARSVSTLFNGAAPSGSGDASVDSKRVHGEREFTPGERAQILAAAPTAETADRTWRVGSHYGIHVYADDIPVATFHRSEDAAVAVEHHNRAINQRDPCAYNKKPSTPGRAL